MRRRLLLSLTLVGLMGCQFQTVAPTPTQSIKPKTGKKPAVQASTNPGATPTYADPGLTRIFDGGTDAVRVQLIGKVKIISDNGASIISDNGASVISNNSGGIISDNGASLIGKVKWQLLAETGDAAAKEFLLADAVVEVVDAQGRMLVGKDGKPITAQTDAQGNYKLDAALPNENLVLRVRAYQGGTLMALMTRDRVGGESALPIDTSSTLGASYVLDRFVEGKQERLDKLPGSEAEALYKDVEAARAELPGMAPTYKPVDMVALLETLRGKVTVVDQTLNRIKALLLAGQTDLGDGLPATQVALGAPRSAVVDANGRLLIAETASGRIRQVVNGKIGLFADSGFVTSLAMASDGSLYVAEPLNHRVRKFSPDGQATVISGTGQAEQGAVGGQAADMAVLNPNAVALSPDGTLYIAESPRSGDRLGRILVVAPSGVTSEIPTPEAGWGKHRFNAIAVAPDGTVYATASTPVDALGIKRPGAAWAFVPMGSDSDDRNGLVVGPDGAVYVSDSLGHRIWKVAADGTKSPFAGTGTAGWSGDGGQATAAQFNQPRGMFFTKDGTMVVADTGNNMIRMIDPTGVIRTVAGTNSATQQGDAVVLPLNTPSGVAIDPQGRVLVGETTGGTIKRIEDGQLKTIAGTSLGYSGDGGPAASAQFDQIGGMVYQGDDLYVLSLENPRLRRIDKNGIVTTLAGNGERGTPSTRTVPANGKIMRRPISIAFGPDGRPVWSDNENHALMKLKDDQTVEVIAGSLDEKDGYAGDGGPATEALFYGPAGIIYDKAGNLYVCDLANFVVRKITPDGKIEHFAGTFRDKALGKLLAFQPGQEEGKPAKDALLIGPLALAIDPDGNLFVSEGGTINLGKLGALESSFPTTAFPQVGGRIRKIASDGTITTVAGPGGKVLTGANGQQALGLVLCMTFDKDGRLILVDSANNQVLALPKGSY